MSAGGNGRRRSVSEVSSVWGLTMMFSWPVRFASFLVAAAGLTCVWLAALAWSEARQVEATRLQGVSAVARVESGRRTIWKGVAGYTVNLSWSDETGRKRIADEVPITEDYAKDVVVGDQFVAMAVAIRYLPGEINASPVVEPDAERYAQSLMTRSAYMAWAGAGLLLFGLALWFFGRRSGRGN
jgi:hypothetical protein